MNKHFKFITIVVFTFISIFITACPGEPRDSNNLIKTLSANPSILEINESGLITATTSESNVNVYFFFPNSDSEYATLNQTQCTTSLNEGIYSCSVTITPNDKSLWLQRPIDVCAQNNGHIYICTKVQTIVRGSLSISLESNTLSKDKSTIATVKLNDSLKITTPITVNLTSAQANIAIINPNICSLSTSSDKCTVKVTANQIGSTKIQASASSYITAESNLAVLALGKLIYITESTFTGKLGNTAAEAITNANAYCNSDLGKPVESNFKAMIMNSSQAGIYGTWVFPYVATEYYNTNGDLIGTTNLRKFDFPLSAAFGVFTSNVWTGMNTDWTENTANNCNDWTDTGNAFGNGSYGNSIDLSSISIFSRTQACNIPAHLYCVQQ